MGRRNRTIATLLVAHIVAVGVWLLLFHAERQPATWMVHVFFWSILGVQFTWGFTVGLVAGPSRRRRPMLWASLLTLFMPLYYVAALFRVLIHYLGLATALTYLAIFVMILACETFCGVLLGARAHSKWQQ